MPRSVMGTVLATVTMAALASAQVTFTAKRSDNYDSNRRDGRFDLRVRVNGPTECAIRGLTVECRTSGQADWPQDEGSECNRQLPRGRLSGLRSTQEDGRSKMTIAEEPSSRNGYRLVVRIDDRYKPGDDGRHHLRIRWDDAQLEDWAGGGWASAPAGGDTRSTYSGWEQRPSSASQSTGRVPGWAIGKFRAYDDASRQQWDVRINDRGELDVIGDGRDARGRISEGSLEFDGRRYDITPEDSGFRARAVNTRAEIFFRRVMD